MAMIKLTLQGICREVEMWQPITSSMPLAYVYGIGIKTQCGNKIHSGWIELNFVEGKTDYTIEDIRDCGYSGMKGNGYGKRSLVRYISFI